MSLIAHNITRHVFACSTDGRFLVDEHLVFLEARPTSQLEALGFAAPHALVAARRGELQINFFSSIFPLRIQSEDTFTQAHNYVCRFQNFNIYIYIYIQ